MILFSIITFFDPYGDLKSDRKQHSRKNYQSEKTFEEVKGIITAYNATADYYSEVKISYTDNRSKTVSDFDTSYYTKYKAGQTTYQEIPGY